MVGKLGSKTSSLLDTIATDFSFQADCPSTLTSTWERYGSWTALSSCSSSRFDPLRWLASDESVQQTAELVGGAGERLSFEYAFLADRLEDFVSFHLGVERDEDLDEDEAERVVVRLFRIARTVELFRRSVHGGADLAGQVVVDVVFDARIPPLSTAVGGRLVARSVKCRVTELLDCAVHRAESRRWEGRKVCEIIAALHQAEVAVLDLHVFRQEDV